MPLADPAPSTLVSDAQSIRGILFDYGNTLAQIRDGPAVFREVLEDLGHRIDDSTALKGVEALKGRWHGRYLSPPRGKRWTEEIRLDCYKTALEAIGFTGDLDRTAREVDNLWNTHERAGLYDDVKPTLESLNGMGITTGVLSQTKMTGLQLKDELESYQIARHFSVVLTSEDVGFDKPDPRFFQTGSSRIGLKNTELWYVGNRYHEDALGARNAGITPVLVERRPRHKSRDCISVHTLLSLSSMLRREQC